MERVWTRLKTTAIKFAEHKRLISVRESRNTVLKICRQEKAKSRRLTRFSTSLRS
jgi:hypothetical protein